MTHTTVFIIVDAGRADYVRPDTMPFLHGLQSTSLSGAAVSPPGFAQRTVLYSGRYPDTSNRFSLFTFDPPRSPFRWVRKLGPLGHLVRPRRALYPLRWGIQKVTRRLTDAYHTDPAWIPPRYLPFFRPCEDMRPVDESGAMGATSIFDRCRDKGLTYRYIGHPISGDDDRVHEALVRELRSGAPTRLFVGQLSATDEMGHHHGPFSRTMQQKVLPKLDGQLASIHAALESAYDSWDLFLVGDHGMAPVEERIDLIPHLRAAHARPARDYVVFVNSTIAVVWYLTERGERELEPILSKIPGTHLLSARERREHRIPTDRQWGDRMLIAERGVMFWPDYFHVTDRPIVGMHGYLDKASESHGLAILASNNGAARTGQFGARPLVDVFPTLCDLIDVGVPPGQEGRSLLRARPRERPPNGSMRVRNAWGSIVAAES
jgi:hypothetical protein